MSITLIKLGYLLIRTIAKPISSVVKKHAIQKNSFREACIRLAQSYHRMEVRLRRRLQRTSSPASPIHQLLDQIKPLEESKAVEIGANFIGEATVFSIVGLAIYLETSRVRAIEKAKKEELAEKIDQVIADVMMLKEKERQREIKKENG